MRFFRHIHRLYGPTNVGLLKEWAKMNTKIAALRNRRIFLLKCRKERIFPNHISNGLNNVNNLLHHQRGRLGHQINTFNLRLRQKLLNLEISITICDLNTMEKKIETIKNKLTIPQHIIIEYDRRLKIKYNRLFHIIKNKNLNKLDKLKEDEANKIIIQNKWFKNLTTVIIPKNVQFILALGPKFSLCPAVSDLKISTLLADLENIIIDMNEEDKNCFRSQYTNIITNYLHKNHGIKDHLTNKFKECKIFLNEHSELVVVKSDKGNVTVVMYKEDYINKSQEILNDKKYYKELKTDPTCTTQQKANRLVAQLKKDNLIDHNTAKALTFYNAVAPRFYSLPKIHKPTLSMRPIMSSINCPNGKLAKFLTDILTNAYNTDNDFYIKDSFAFSEFINDYQLPLGYVVVSFDVVSLFTNLPLQLIIESLTRNWNVISNHCNLDLDSVIKILKFIFDSNYCVFNNTYYKQIFGTPMGSKISPILANFVLDDVVKDCLSRIPFNIPFIKRYVDDLLLAVPSDKIDEVLNTFNNYNNDIQFTVEKETENSIPFLDMRVIRNELDNKLRTKWYRKSMSSGRYINYHSYHHPRMKINLMLALKYRVVKVTHTQYKKEALKELKGLLIENSYPLNLINKMLFNTEQNLNYNNNNNISAININANVGIVNDRDGSMAGDHMGHGVELGDRLVYRSLPYIEDLTSRLTNLFKHTNTIIAKKNIKTVAKLYSKTKTALKDKDKSNVVYRIQCNNCDRAYIGQTSRVLHGRLISHKSDCNRNVKSCGLAEHVIETGHKMDYNNAKVLTVENNYHKRIFLEMVHINNEENNLNKKSDINNLSKIYTYILKLEKDNNRLT